MGFLWKIRIKNKNGSQISRMLKRLRNHGLIKKVGRTYKYYLTNLGRKVVMTALKLRRIVIIPSLAESTCQFKCKSYQFYDHFELNFNYKRLKYRSGKFSGVLMFFASIFISVFPQKINTTGTKDANIRLPNNHLFITLKDFIICLRSMIYLSYTYSH